MKFTDHLKTVAKKAKQQERIFSYFGRRKTMSSNFARSDQADEPDVWAVRFAHQCLERAA
jgi:hypothetical protein